MAAAPDPVDEVLRSTDGKANFQRLARLLISGGTSLLREIFDAIHPPSNLPTVLSNPATKKQLKAAKLTKPQWDCVYPSPGVYGKSADFDVTLLFRLLRTITSPHPHSLTLIPPTTGWDALPASTDHSLTADLVRIKYYRNSVYGHVNQKMEILDDQFLTFWHEISEALVRIAAQISPTKEREWQRVIYNYLKSPLTTEDERNVQELEEWYRNDIDVKKRINQLETTVREEYQDTRNELNNTTQVLREEHQDTRKEVNTATQVLCEEVQDIKDQLGEVQQSIKRQNLSAANSQSTGAHIHVHIDCEANTGPEGGATGMVITPRQESQTVKQERIVVPVSSNQPQAVVQGATAVSEVSNHQQAAGLTGGNVGTEDIPSAQEVLNFIAITTFKTVDTSNPEELNGFLEYLKKVRKVLVTDARSGSLIITVECSTLQILEELWEDYRKGHLNEMAEKFLVTEDILKKFGLIAVKLKTAIVEEEYRACREYFLKRSATDSSALGEGGCNGDFPKTQDSSVIVKKIPEQFKQLRKKRKESHDAFLRWMPIRAHTMEQLEVVATKPHETREISTTALVMGGLLVAAAFAFAPPVAVATVEAAAGAAALARVIVIAAGTILNILGTSGLPLVQAAIEEDRKSYSELQQQLDSLENFIFTMAVFLKTLPNDPVLLMELEGSGFEFLREPTFFKDIDSSTEGREHFGARFFRAATSVTGEGASRTRTQATKIAGFAIDSVLPSGDITLFVETSLSKPGASRSKAKEDIRGILKEMECPKKEEIQGLVDSFIDVKFTEAYYGVVITSERTTTDVAHSSN